MVERSVVAELPTGLDARPAAKLAVFVKDYPGELTAYVGEKSANMKSMLGLMALAIKPGGRFVIRVAGEGEEEMAGRIVDFIRNMGEESRTEYK